MAGKKEIKLVPTEEQPYEIPENWCWVYGKTIFGKMISQKPAGETFWYIDIDSIDNKNQCVTEPKVIDTADAPSRASRHLQYGDTVFSLVRPYLKNIAFIDETLSDCIGSTGFYVCRPHKAINPLYIYRLMTSPYVVDGLNAFMKGDNSPSIRGENIEDFAYPIPPLAEQKRIVDTIAELFADLDKAAENAQAILDSAEKRKFAVLHQAFTGQLIGMDAYSTIPLESIADTIRIGPFGSALHKEDYICGGIPVINPKHIKNQEIVSEDKVTVSAKKAAELTSYRLKENDIIIARRGDMGRSAPVSAAEEGWLCGTGSMIIRLKNGYDGAFYSQIIASKACVDYLEENCVGSTLKNLNEKIIRQLPIPNLTQEQQQEIVRILDELLGNEQRIKEAAEEMLDKIAMMKKSILADAFRGKLGTNDPSDQPATELLKEILS